MKIFLRLPNGTEFRYEHEPMDNEHFFAVCVLIGAAIFIGFLLMTTALRR